MFFNQRIVRCYVLPCFNRLRKRQIYRYL